MKKTILAIALAAASATAFAAPTPTASLGTAAFTEFTGTNVNAIEQNNTLFWMYESTLTTQWGTFSSYLLAFDPVNNGTLKGTVTFGGDVVVVADTKAELQLSDIFFAKPGVTYNWKANSGLEANDTLSYSGATVTLNWKASNPGDHVRVLVSAVPEPESYAMFLAGLGVLGAMVRRKRV